MGYSARTPIAAGDAPSLSDYNQGMANEAQLKAWADELKPSLTNKSGGNLDVGAVVILDASNDDAFTTTTVVGDPRVLGALWEAIANNVAGRLWPPGPKATVLVQGNVARGDFLRTSATAGRAESAGRVRSQGCFAVATTAYAGGGAGSVSAIMLSDIELGLSAGSLYAGGGDQSAGATATTYKWDSATDTTGAVAGAALTQARRGAAGGKSSTRGYYCGGDTLAGRSIVVDRLTFATEITAAVSSLPAVNYAGSAFQSETDLYYIHGENTGGTATQVRYKMNFASETWASLSASAATARTEAAGLAGADYGYVLGGEDETPTALSSIFRLAFATDTETAVSSTLSSARSGVAGAEGSTAGYIAGGDTASVQVTTDKFVFATEGCAVAGSAALSTARQYAAGASDATALGYFLGGSTTTGQFPTTGESVVADKLTISTDTTAAVSGANLPTATAHGGGSFGG